MKKITLLALSGLIAGCGGSSTVSQNIAVRSGSPFTGVYNGRSVIAGKDSGPARLGVQEDGWGVFSIADSRGKNEDWLVKVKDDGTFTGQWFGQDFRDGDLPVGKVEFSPKDHDHLTMTMKFRYRSVGAVVLDAVRE